MATTRISIQTTVRRASRAAQESASAQSSRAVCQVDLLVPYGRCCCCRSYCQGNPSTDSRTPPADSPGPSLLTSVVLRHLPHFLSLSLPLYQTHPFLDTRVHVCHSFSFPQEHQLSMVLRNVRFSLQLSAICIQHVVCIMFVNNNILV